MTQSHPPTPLQSEIKESLTVAMWALIGAIDALECAGVTDEAAECQDALDTVHAMQDAMAKTHTFARLNQLGGGFISYMDGLGDIVIDVLDHCHEDICWSTIDLRAKPVDCLADWHAPAGQCDVMITVQAWDYANALVCAPPFIDGPVEIRDGRRIVRLNLEAMEY